MFAPIPSAEIVQSYWSAVENGNRPKRSGRSVPVFRGRLQNDSRDTEQSCHPSLYKYNLSEILSCSSLKKKVEKMMDNEWI